MKRDWHQEELIPSRIRAGTDTGTYQGGVGLNRGLENTFQLGQIPLLPPKGSLGALVWIVREVQMNACLNKPVNTGYMSIFLGYG